MPSPAHMHEMPAQIEQSPGCTEGTASEMLLAVARGLHRVLRKAAGLGRRLYLLRNYGASSPVDRISVISRVHARPIERSGQAAGFVQSAWPSSRVPPFLPEPLRRGPRVGCLLPRALQVVDLSWNIECPSVCRGFTARQGETP